MLKMKKHHCLLNVYLFYLILFAVTIFLFFSLPLSAQTTVNPGRVVGNVTFANVSSGVSGYLASNPVINWSGANPELFPVRLYQTGNVLPAATALYNPINTAPDNQTYNLANFDINPNVAPGGSDFVVETNPIIFSNGAEYRFGSLDPRSPAYRLCQGVRPLTDNPDGTRCDISECAVMLPLRIRFGGMEENKNAIDNNYPAICTATVYVKEAPESVNFAWQAKSETKGFSVDALKISGEVLPVLIRATDSVIKIQVRCEVKIKSGVTGYPIIPITGMTPLVTEIEIGPYVCAAQPPASIDVSVPTLRNAGVLEGLFDVSGYNETRTEIRVDDLPWYYYTTAQAVPSGGVPSVPWRFNGIPEGDHEVSAKAIVDDGNFMLEFPHRANFNQKVDIVKQQTKNIGSTFIAKPNIVKGKLVFVDPGGRTDLKGIQLGPLGDFYSYANSYMQAEGVNQVAANFPKCSNRSSGYGGRSLGRLIGSYHSAQHQADLTYELLLTGLSPEDGSVDGAEACPTPWNISGVYISMITETNPSESGYGDSLINFNEYFPLLADVNNPELIRFPDQKLCFGKMKLDIHVNPDLGTLNYPHLYVYQESADLASNEFNTLYSFGYSDWRGTPNYFDEGRPTATVTATLPEGLNYRIYPYLYFRPVDQTSGYGTYMNLNPFIFPETGFLGCGDEIDVCASLTDEQGNYSLLSISYPADTDYCLTNGNLQLDFSVNLSDNSNVAKVGYVLDPQNLQTADLNDSSAVILCPSNCGPNPVYTISLSSLSSGSHALKIIAIAANGCVTRRVYNFYVQSQPLMLQCPANFVVELLSGETSVLSSDPRIVAHLNPTVSGGCGLPVTIHNDIPDEFTIGQTGVNFWISGTSVVQACTTLVTVKSTEERVISFICNDPLTGEKVIKKRSILDDSIDLTTYSHPQFYHFEYNNDGSRMAVIPNDSGAVRIIDTENNGIVSFFPIPVGYKLYDIDFHPHEATKYAIIGSLNSNPDQHAIFIFQGSTQLSRFNLPLFPPSLRISRPLIAWSPDGTKISAAFTDPAPAVNQYGLWASEWSVINNQIVLPPNGLYEMRPNLQNRESIRELVYQDGDWRVIGTDATITRAIKRTGIQQIGPIWVAKNTDMDLTPDGKAAAYLGTTNLLPLQQSRIYGVSPLDRNAVPNVYAGPTIQYGKSVAISSDAAFIAVATNDKVLIYSFPSFTLIKEISAVSPRNLKFKPLMP